MRRGDIVVVGIGRADFVKVSQLFTTTTVVYNYWVITVVRSLAFLQMVVSFVDFVLCSVMFFTSFQRSYDKWYPWSLNLLRYFIVVLYYHSTIVSFYHIWSRERAKYETVIHCSFPRFDRFRTEEILTEPQFLNERNCFHRNTVPENLAYHHLSLVVLFIHQIKIFGWLFVLFTLFARTLRNR